MNKRIQRSPVQLTLLAFSSVTLLSTVGACGRTSGNSDQQLMDLASKSSTRLKAQNGGTADSLTKRNAEATERLLRGLIDKEREERIAADEALSKRIDALELELRAFKDQVNARFAEVDKRDESLRAEMKTSLEELRSMDKVLADKIEAEAKARIEELAQVRKDQADLETKTTNRFDAVEKSFQQKLDAQKQSLQSAITSVKNDLQKDLDTKDADLRKAIADNDASLRDTLQKEKDAISSRIALVEKAAADERARLDRTVADLDAARKALESQIGSVSADLVKAKKELSDKIDTATAAQRLALEVGVKLLEERMEGMNDALRRENAALAARQSESERKITSLESSLAAEVKARKDAIASLKSETEALIKSTDAKTQTELRSLISQVEQASASSLESVQKQILDKLASQDASTRVALLGLTNEIARVAEEGRKSQADLEKRMLSSIENVRGELIAKAADLNSALSAARAELSEKISNGLSGLSADFSEKLLIAEKQLNDKLRAEVASRRVEIESLKLGLAAAESKFSADMQAQNAKIKADMDAMKASIDAAMLSLFNNFQAETLRNQETASALSLMIAEQQAALLASETNYSNQLQTIKDQQTIANANQDAAAAAERQALLDALQAEREARAAELLKLGSDMSLLKSAQDQARVKLETDLKAKVQALAGKTDEEKQLLEAQIAQLNGALTKLDENTFATVKNLKDALVVERQKTEQQIFAAVSVIETKLEQASLETQKVAARVEAVNRAHEEFKAFVAKNYATKGELEALNLRVEGLEYVTKVMNADMIRANAEIKALISSEVNAAKDALSARIAAVEGSVEGIRNQLGAAISDYQSQITSLSSKLSSEIAKVKTDMRSQDDALYAALSDQKALQDTVNADIMMSVKRQAANFEAMSQNVRKELSDKLVQLEGSIDRTNASLEAERVAVQAQFAEVVKQEQALKDGLAKELASLKDEIKDVAKVANQGLKLAEANAEQINLVRADLDRQAVTINGVTVQLNAHEAHVAKKFKLQDDQIAKLNDSVDKMKEDFNKRIAEVAAQAEEMVENLGADVQANFKKVTTDIAKLRSAQRALEAKLTGHYVDTFKLEWDSDIEEFALLVADDQSLLLTKKELRNGKSVVVGKGPLVSTLESFAEVRKAFLAALQPRQRADNGERVEFYDKSFVPIMTQCGGNAEATFANALGRDSFDFLADEFIAGLIAGSRGAAVDALYLKNSKLTDGDSLHHFIMLEALRNLEGGSDDPKCMSQIKAWANEVLNSNDFRTHRERIAANTRFQARLAEFVKAVGDLKAGAEKLERRVANRISKGQTKIVAAMSKISNPVAIFGQTKPEDVATELLGRMAHTLSEGADASYDAIARQEEYDKMVSVQKQFVQALKDENKDDAAALAAAERREKAMNDKIASLEGKLAAFDKTAKDVESLKGKVDNLNASLSKALDVVMTLAIRAGHPDLVAATKEAGQLIGYSPGEVGLVKPKILEVQHFFASPALANGSDTCSGSAIKRGAGVKFWTQGGQCWVNFRSLSRNRWSSAAQTIWFRVFGAAQRMQVWSQQCGSGGAASCNSTFRYQTGSSSVMSGASNVSSIMVGQPSEGVFDIRMPNILDPYIQRSLSWNGETINFTAFGSEGQGSVSAAYTVQLYSPIVLDFMSIGRPQFSSVEASKARFDLDGDGRAERTGWMSGYRDVGLLALDLNGNGLIDSGRELFGEATIVNKTGRKAKDGYAALAQYDSNKDGFIDNKDDIYGKLVVWFDRNHDGKTNSDEIVSLAQSEVSRIALKHTRLKDAERFENGNEMRTTAKFWGPKQCGSSGCNSYDVYFSTAFMVSQKK